ncbi:MAG: DUF1569 domain-containing protein [Acidobacteriia bacterium]|nr:DUF1569 domain-containing protein [Terriglobia bacterium]
MDTHLGKLQQALSTAIGGMSAEQLSWHPAGKWCAAEVLEHLYLTYTGTVKGFERVTAAGKSLATTPTFSQRLQTLVVLGLGYLPEGRKAPAVAQPRGLPQEQVVSGVFPAIGQMDEIITRCEKALGSGKKLLDHPILGPLTAKQWRKFHLVHGLHHAKQIQRLRSARSSA